MFVVLKCISFEYVDFNLHGRYCTWLSSLPFSPSELHASGVYLVWASEWLVLVNVVTASCLSPQRWTVFLPFHWHEHPRGGWFTCPPGGSGGSLADRSWSTCRTDTSCVSLVCGSPAAPLSITPAHAAPSSPVWRRLYSECACFMCVCRPSECQRPFI